MACATSRPTVFRTALTARRDGQELLPDAADFSAYPRSRETLHSKSDGDRPLESSLRCLRCRRKAIRSDDNHDTQTVAWLRGVEPHGVASAPASSRALEPPGTVRADRSRI